MAETSSSRPLWIAAGAALAILVVILAVFAGPSVVSCTGDDDGFGSCVQKKLADSGLVSPAAPEKAATAEVAPDAIKSPETTPSPTAELPVVPELGLVRAEPDGSLVIAGSAAPGSTVEIYANGELLGTATAESSGDWVLVPDAPLPAGGVEISVINPQTKQVAKQSVVVVIQDDKTSEPLVVATVGGEADSVLQGLMAQQKTAMDVAEAKPAPEAAENAAEDTASAAMTSAESAPADEDRMEVATAEEPAAEEKTASEPAAVEDAAPKAETADKPMDVAKATDDMVKGVDDLENRIQAMTPAVQPTIDAIEIDGDSNFFAGSGEEGATVRLYVDNQHVGDTTVENGRWLLETPSSVLKSQSQRVRIDQLGVGSSDVVGRAEVEFVFNEPSSADKTAVAQADISVVEIPTPDFAIDTDKPLALAGAGADKATPPAVMVPTPDFAINTNEPIALASNGNASGSGAAASGVNVNVPTPDFSIDTGIPVTIVAEGEPADATINPDKMTEDKPVTIAKTDTEAPAMTDDVAMAEEPAADAGDMTESDVPVLVAEPVGDPRDQRFASGKAIIRHGDNLWTIASRVYGSGYEFLAIYRANKGQIRNPNLIYPGQVFELPAEAAQ